MFSNLILALKIYGLAIVVSMAVALLIRVVVVVVSRPQSKRRAAEAKVAAVPPVTAPPEIAGHIAAIAAAIYATMGAHRIVRIRAQGGRGAAWTLEGRHEHHASHKVTHQPRNPKSN